MKKKVWILFSLPNEYHATKTFEKLWWQPPTAKEIQEETGYPCSEENLIDLYIYTDEKGIRFYKYGANYWIECFEEPIS